MRRARTWSVSCAEEGGGHEARLGCRLANVWHSEYREVQIYGSERGWVILMIDVVWPSPTVARSRHRCTCRTNLLPVPPASLTDP